MGVRGTLKYEFPILARTIWVFGKWLFDKSLVYTADEAQGPPGQGAQQQDDDQIPLSPEVGGPEAEVGPGGTYIKI
jgi:hypothetical protein